MMAKPSTPADYRMIAAEFDKMMRGALSAPTPDQPKKAKRVTKKVAKKTARKRK